MSQSLFSPEELERFAKHNAKVLHQSHGALARYQVTNKQGQPTNSHQRGYVYGDRRCCCCLKWLNENNPEELSEIHFGKGGHRYHKRCPVYSPYTATLISCPKFHGTRRRIVDAAKRY